MAWQMTHLDYTGKALGEIVGAHDRIFTFQMNAPQTIEFKLDIQNPMVASLLAARSSASMIVLYRAGTLKMIAEILSLDVIGSSSTKQLAVVAQETMWPRLMGRLIGKDNIGFIVNTPTDKGLIMHNALTALNGGTNANTTITVGTRVASSTAVVAATYFTTFGSMLQSLALTANGFDFWQVPPSSITPGTNAHDWTTGALWIAPLRGSTQPNVVFEYGPGTRTNISDYNFQHDRSQLANDIAVLPPSYPNNVGLGISDAIDTGSIVNFGYRDSLSPTNLTDKTLQGQLATDTLSILKQPREMFTFNPVPGIGPFFPIDFDLGDIINGRIDDYGITLLNAQVRVYGAVVSLDDNGGETQTLTLSINTA
jgi:hypothetical protein